MVVREIRKDLFHVGAIDWDLRLFDELIPLPDGTSYNSYLIKGRSKTALIDTGDLRKGIALAKVNVMKEVAMKILDVMGKIEMAETDTEE